MHTSVHAYIRTCIPTPRQAHANRHTHKHPLYTNVTFDLIIAIALAYHMAQSMCLFTTTRERISSPYAHPHCVHYTFDLIIAVTLSRACLGQANGTQRRMEEYHRGHIRVVETRVSLTAKQTVRKATPLNARINTHY